jgi:hypothetical protein
VRIKQKRLGTFGIAMRWSGDLQPDREVCPMRLELETITAATLALATLVVVSTALAAVAPAPETEHVAITCQD